MSQFSVEVADLGGWAEQVGRGGRALGKVHSYATSEIADANFGRILEKLSGDYSKFLPVVHTALQLDGDRISDAESALIYAGDEYRRTDRDFATAIAKLDDTPITVVDDKSVDGFKDTASATEKLVAPTVDTRTLPIITFGLIFDRVVGVIKTVSDFDCRAEVTDLIAGDIGKAGTQVSAWRNVAAAMEVVRVNLKQGQSEIQKTWIGKAATSQTEYFGKWDTSLSNQQQFLAKLADHLRHAVDEAVAMAQIIVDAILIAFQTLMGAWTAATIPGWGQWKLVKSVKNTLTLLNELRLALTLFATLLATIVHFINLGMAMFMPDALPPAPATA
ncbi:hypothetical protein [Nocardia sp. NPDC051832]|uniref:WXG100 family type VII secretion target n=1 Tax=Nocardia sp. NPDC051832 TaxID=3155673 RepID=UPI0034373311